MKEGSIVHMKCIKAAENNCFQIKRGIGLLHSQFASLYATDLELRPFLKVAFLTAFAMKGAIHLAKFGKSFIANRLMHRQID